MLTFPAKINQQELSEILDPILSPTGSTHPSEPLRLHNQLVAAIYANSTREMPDHTVASWVSANDKPLSSTTSKVVSGNAAEQRRKAEVMALPGRDRRRLKDIGSGNNEDEGLYLSMLADVRRLPKINNSAFFGGIGGGVPQSAGGMGGLSKSNYDLEIRKRFAVPLSVESGEFPDTQSIEARMTPICYENSLVGGHSGDAAQFMAVATETFVKGFLSSVFDKTRANGPGASGSAGSGGGGGWVTSWRYRRQLEQEEELFMQGLITRDKSGLLPVEAKAAAERGSLGMQDMRLALEVGECGVGQMPVVVSQILNGFREGELENWDDFMEIDGYEERLMMHDESDLVMTGMGTPKTKVGGINEVNGTKSSGKKTEDEDIDMSDYGWEGADERDQDDLNSLLDAILA